MRHEGGFRVKSMIWRFIRPTAIIIGLLVLVFCCGIVLPVGTGYAAAGLHDGEELGSLPG